MNTQHQPALTTTETAIEHLNTLGAKLTAAGYRTRLDVAPDRIPSLHVQNPAGVRLQETIYAAPRSGSWSYWWSWAEPIAADADEAAVTIARVLAATRS
jgi:hypothetical protein